MEFKKTPATILQFFFLTKDDQEYKNYKHFNEFVRDEKSRVSSDTFNKTIKEVNARVNRDTKTIRREVITKGTTTKKQEANTYHWKN